MLEVIFYSVLFSDILLLLGVTFSVAFPRYRIWPPPSKTSWQYWISWIFVTLSSVGVPIVGLLDWESLWPTNWVWFVVGGVLVSLSVVLIYWGIRALSFHQSLGLKGKLITTGPYKYTRNPQYLALILIYISLILVTSSYLAFLTGSLLILVYVLTPLSEEPWLTNLYGEEYLQYRNRVFRFFGFRSEEKEESEIEEDR